MTNEQAIKEIKSLLKQKDKFSLWRVLESVTQLIITLGLWWVAYLLIERMGL